MRRREHGPDDELHRLDGGYLEGGPRVVVLRRVPVDLRRVERAPERAQPEALDDLARAPVARALCRVAHEDLGALRLVRERVLGERPGGVVIPLHQDLRGGSRARSTFASKPFAPKAGKPSAGLRFVPRRWATVELYSDAVMWCRGIPSMAMAASCSGVCSGEPYRPRGCQCTRCSGGIPGSDPGTR